MDFGRLQRGEFIGFAGVGVLLLSLFLPWFETNPDNANAQINGQPGEFNAFETYGTLDWLLVAACLAPFILAWIVIRQHKLTWRPGEITMIVGMVAFALILLDGVILGRPGGTARHAVDIGISYGYWVGLFGAFLISLGGFRRQAENVKAKPPGI